MLFKKVWPCEFASSQNRRRRSIRNGSLFFRRPLGGILQRFFLITLIALAIVFQTLYARSLMREQNVSAVAQANDERDIAVQPGENWDSQDNGEGREPNSAPSSDQEGSGSGLKSEDLPSSDS